MALSAGTIATVSHRIARMLAWFITNEATTATPVGGDAVLFYDASDNYEPKYMTLTQALSAGYLGNTYALTLDIPVIGDESVYYMYVPYAGTITTIISVIDAAISSADATITAAIGATGVTGGVITVTQSGSAAGDIDSVSPSALNVVTAGSTINFTVTGAGTSAVDCHLTVIITRS